MGDDGAIDPGARTVEPTWILYDFGAVEGRTEDGRMGDLAAEATTDAVIVDMRDRIGFQRIAARLDGQ